MRTKQIKLNGTYTVSKYNYINPTVIIYFPDTYKEGQLIVIQEGKKYRLDRYKGQAGVIGAMRMLSAA